MVLIKEGTNIHNFEPATSIPDLSDKVVLVTGGNAGVGKQTVLELSRHRPKKLYMTARSQAKFDAAMKDILAANSEAEVDLLELDFGSVDSVKKAAAAFLAREERLDILICNAGILGAPAGLTHDGHEIHFGTNYFGHAALTALLLPLLQHTATLPSSSSSTTTTTSTPTTSPRVVHVSSAAAWKHLTPRTIDWASTAPSTRTDLGEYSRYAISKLAQILFARECAARYPAVRSVAVHPGRVATGILDGFMGTWRRWSVMGIVQQTFDLIATVMSVEEGAWTQLWAATWPEEGDVENGALYVPRGVREFGDKKCQSGELARELWTWTDKELRRFGIELPAAEESN